MLPFPGRDMGGGEAATFAAVESLPASTVCHLTHPDGLWQQHTLISSTLANLAIQQLPNSPKLGLGCSLYSLHFPSPHSNGQINFFHKFGYNFSFRRKIFYALLKPLAV